MKKKLLKIESIFNWILNFFQILSRFCNIKKSSLAVYHVGIFLLLSGSSNAQSCLSAFDLNAPTLYTGTAGQVGAVYKFANAAQGVDIHIKIDLLFKASLVDMDVTSTGYARAWQPQVLTDSTGGFIEWTISFKKAGTNSDTTVCTPITALDVDGNNTNLREFIQTKGYDYYDLGSPTSLTISNPGLGWTLQALSPLTSYVGIDATATNVQIQISFLDVKSIKWRTGATNKESRLYSFYFNTFLTCSNITSGGLIGSNETYCGKSFDPANITNVTTPSGGAGVIEYRWLFNTVSSNPTDLNWRQIDRESGSTYDPRTISQTTYYKRQARRVGCAEWCEASNVVSKIVYPLPVVSIATSENSCTANDSKVLSGATFNMTASGGVSYAWSNGLGSGATKAVNPTVNTSYSVTATDANGCTATDNTNVNIISLPIPVIAAFENTCKANDDRMYSKDTVNFIASGGKSYVWNNSLGTGAKQMAIPSSTTTYVVTVTDNNGCTATASKTITIVKPLEFKADVHDVKCRKFKDGYIILKPAEGTSPYTFVWENGVTTQDRFNLELGVYTVTITDADLCTQIITSTVFEPKGITVTPAQTDITCFGGSNGTINLTTTGGKPGYTYTWNDGSTLQDRVDLAAGTYRVTTVDIKGCDQIDSVKLVQPPIIEISPLQTDVACFGESNGAINLSVSGGVSSYTYNWSNGETTQNLTGLSIGTYIVTVTDANGCTKTSSTTITQPLALTLKTSTTNANCGSANGTINLTVTGGVSPYTFNWQDGPTTEDRTGIDGGTYNVTVTDAKGCTAITSAIINTTAGSSLTVSTTQPTCAGTSTGAINLTAIGSGPFTFDWGGGITSKDRTGLPAGNYTVTMTNGTGCKTINAITLTSPSVINVSAAVTQVSCMGSSTGAINITTTGGTAPYTYNWSSGITSEDRTGLVVGTYMVTVTDANGCQQTHAESLTQPAALNISASLTQVTCIGGTDGAIDLTVAGGTLPYTFNWGGGITTEDRMSIGEGNHSVIVTDANGCTATMNATLTAQKGAPNAPTGLKH